MKWISCGRKKGEKIETWNFLLFSLEILNENYYFFKDICKKKIYYGLKYTYNHLELYTSCRWLLT